MVRRKQVPQRCATVYRIAIRQAVYEAARSAGTRFQSPALHALEVASEAFLVSLMEDAALSAALAGRDEPSATDILLACRMRGL
jgi:histone H3/H4